MISKGRVVLGVILLLGLHVVAGYILLVVLRPQCEPCLPTPTGPCPPCVSEQQYRIAFGVGLLDLLLFPWLLIQVRRQQQ